MRLRFVNSVFLLSFISSFSFAVGNEEDGKVLGKRGREEPNQQVFHQEGFPEQVVPEDALPEQDRKMHRPLSTHTDFLLHYYDSKYLESRDITYDVLNKILDPVNGEIIEYKAAKSAFIDLSCKKLKEPIATSPMYEEPQIALEMAMILFLDFVGRRDTSGEIFEQDGVITLYRSILKSLTMLSQKSYNEYFSVWGAMFLDWRQRQNIKPKKAVLTGKHKDHILHGISIYENKPFFYEPKTYVYLKNEETLFFHRFREFPHILNVLEKHGVEIKIPQMLRMEHDYPPMNHQIQIQQPQAIPHQFGVVPQLGQNFAGVWHNAMNQRNFVQQPGNLPIQAAYRQPVPIQQYFASRGAPQQCVLPMNRMNQQNPPQGLVGGMGNPDPQRVRPISNVAFWRQKAEIMYAYRAWGDQFELKRQFVQNLDIPRASTMHPRYHIENAVDIPFDDPLFEEIIPVYQSLGYEMDFRVMKYLRSLEALCKYNILVTYELAVRGNVQGGLSSNLLYHGFGLNVVLHPEQSDANLEARAPNFYHILQSAWNEIKEIQDHDFREIVARRFAEEALSSNAICMEGISASIDAWYQNNKDLIKKANLFEKYKDNYMCQKDKYSLLAELYQDLEAQKIYKDQTYYNFKNDYDQYVEIVRNAQSGSKIKLGNGEISTDFLKGMIADLNTRMDNRRNQILESNASEFGIMIYSLLCGRMASDGQITIEDLKQIAEGLCIQIEFPEENGLQMSVSDEVKADYSYEEDLDFEARLNELLG
ncbi:MAG: hypothetical protein Q8S31_09935 [Alphaproteobacteria bacterium]|nr:hypothetical protein [Alphaproteobacteria bacterium]